MNNKRNVFSCLFAVGVVLGASSATLTVNQVRQRYPWNGLVDIDYTIALEQGESFDADDDLEVLMIDKGGDTVVTNRANRFLQTPLPMTAGSHRITWDANYDGVTNYTDDAEFHLKIDHYAATYMVIDISGGTTAEVYKVDFYNGVPANRFLSNEYRGDKIVLRRIHPGSYVAGSPTTEEGRNQQYAGKETQHPVALSRPFYIGIFEVTQKQYQNVTGKDPSTYKGAYRPVETVTYDEVRGGNWPPSEEVGPGSFAGKLAAKCKAKDADGNYTLDVKGFDLPTEFQWEYACRAGTTGPRYSTGTNWGRWKETMTDVWGGYTDQKHTVVGCYEPNAWGLYDMLGNVYEWCRDRLSDDPATLKQYVDPKGNPDPNTEKQVQRGGGWSISLTSARAAYRYPAGGKTSDLKYESRGFRISLTLP